MTDDLKVCPCGAPVKITKYDGFMPELGFYILAKIRCDKGHNASIKLNQEKPEEHADAMKELHDYFVTRTNERLADEKEGKE